MSEINIRVQIKGMITEAEKTGCRYCRHCLRLKKSGAISECFHFGRDMLRRDDCCCFLRGLDCKKKYPIKTAEGIVFMFDGDILNATRLMPGEVVLFNRIASLIRMAANVKEEPLVIPVG